MSKEPIYSIKVSDMERRIIIKSLTLLKDRQIQVCLYEEHLQ